MDSSWPASQMDPPVQPLTRAEAQALLARHPAISIWSLLAWQAAAGVLMAALWWGLSGSRSGGLSSLCGAAVAFVPNLLMAQAMFGSRMGRTLGGLVLWEAVKVVVVVAMLVAAPLLVVPLSWPALLVTALLCMKVMVVLLLLQGRRKQV